jgi:pimeloyl-ACP methyl ester carboxylesterase
MHQPTAGERIVDGKRLETLWLAPEAGTGPARPSGYERNSPVRAGPDSVVSASYTKEPGRPVIVMLHEGLGSVAMWKDFPHRIAGRTGCEVFVYSRYGHGGSDRLAEKRPVRYMHHEAEIVLPSLLADAGIERPILLGHSDGGSIALIYASAYPDSPRGLILEAPHVFVEDLSVKSIAAAKTAYQTTDLPRKLGRYHQHVDATFWGWNDIWLDPRFRAWNIESCLDSIRCPVLVIQGEDDEYGTARQIEAIQARIPSAQGMLLPRCAHSPHRDRPEATLERIAEFVMDHD